MIKRFSTRALVFSVVVGLTAAAVPVMSSASEPDGKSGPAPTFGSCKKTSSSGSGATRFSWCFTTEGSVQSLEHPAGAFNIGSELDGFCLAAGDGSYVSTENMQAPTYPNANSVAHKTGDNKFVITETFAQTTATRTVTVTMKVQNISGSAQPMTLTRITDLDADGVASNVYMQTGRSVLASNPGGNTAILSATTTGLPVETFTMPYADPTITLTYLDVSCDNVDANANVGPSGPSDQVAAVRYDLGTLNNNASKTVKFTYQVLS